jgi:seipin
MSGMKDPGVIPRCQAVLDRTVSYGKETVNLLAERSTSMAFSFMSSFLTIVLVLILSVFLYGTFYYAYIPKDVYKMPLDLQFHPCNESSLRCSYPSGQLTLGRAVKLNPGQPYTLTSKLVLPDNPVNEDHGMFMTCLTISSVKGQVDQACKASVLEYRSSLLRSLETLAFLPAFLSGFMSQKQELHIDFFDKFELNPHNPGEILTLEILSKQLEVSHATLDIHADLKGLKFLMYRHPWISMVIGIGTNILLLGSIIMLSWTRFLVLRPQTADRLSEVQEVEEPNSDGLFLVKTIFVALMMIMLVISGSAY